MKPYNLWMSEPAKKYMVESYEKLAPCRYCQNKEKHPEGQMPAKGSKQGRVKEDGLYNEAARNRVPPDLAQAAGQAMMRAWRETCVRAK